MQDYIDQATARWLELLPVEPVYAHEAAWVLRAAIIDLDITKATDVYFQMTVIGDITNVDISVFNDKEHVFSFQQATMQTSQLFDALVSYGDTINTAIKQYLG